MTNFYTQISACLNKTDYIDLKYRGKSQYQRDTNYFHFATNNLDKDSRTLNFGMTCDLCYTKSQDTHSLKLDIEGIPH